MGCTSVQCNHPVLHPGLATVSNRIPAFMHHHLITPVAQFDPARFGGKGVDKGFNRRRHADLVQALVLVVQRVIVGVQPGQA